MIMSNVHREKASHIVLAAGRSYHGALSLSLWNLESIGTSSTLYYAGYITYIYIQYKCYTHIQYTLLYYVKMRIGNVHLCNIISFILYRFDTKCAVEMMMIKLRWYGGYMLYDMHTTQHMQNAAGGVGESILIQEMFHAKWMRCVFFSGAYCCCSMFVSWSCCHLKTSCPTTEYASQMLIHSNEMKLYSNSIALFGMYSMMYGRSIRWMGPMQPNSKYSSYFYQTFYCCYWRVLYVWSNQQPGDNGIMR